MVNNQLVNHKGTFCPYAKILFCQEGYCQDCQIYLDRKPDFPPPPKFGSDEMRRYNNYLRALQREEDSKAINVSISLGQDRQAEGRDAITKATEVHHP